MSKYKYEEGYREISGFKGSYEAQCRMMVIAGMEWLDEHPDANPTFDQFKNITGLTTNENEDMQNMQTHMNEAIENGASVAMMQAATNHILYAKSNGWDKYIEEMQKPDEDE